MWKQEYNEQKTEKKVDNWYTTCILMDMIQKCPWETLVLRSISKIKMRESMLKEKGQEK